MIGIEGQCNTVDIVYYEGSYSIIYYMIYYMILLYEISACELVVEKAFVTSARKA